ncbi:hypothetical protein BSKO_00720 [Bryopsis sp. KO-2023]|nr:hypothetical protein BSKO_00720 [Bryopsis sp. KO-2023]
MSSATVTSQELIKHVEAHVGEELLVVTYKWLSRKYCVDADFAKRVLFDFISKHAERVTAVYLLGGWTKDSKSHVFQLVPHADLEVRKKLLEPITSLHVYSVAPKQKTQTLVDIWAVNHEQTSELYKRMMQGDDSEQVRCLSNNTCGGISFDGVGRIVKPKLVSISPPAPVEETVAKPEASKPDAVKKAPPVSSKSKKKRGKSNIKEAFSKNVGRKSSKQEDPPPSPPMEEKNSVMVDAEDALKNAHDSMQDSDEDDIVFQQRSSANLGRSNRMQLDEDEADKPEPPRLLDENNGQDFCLTQRVGSISLTQQENRSDQDGKEASAEENRQEMNVPNMEASAPTTSGKIITRKKVVKVYYDDDGCEATEEVWEEVVQDVEAESVVQSTPSNTQTAKRKSKTQESEPAAKRQRGGKVKSGSQRSIMSFFGKK